MRTLSIFFILFPIALYSQSVQKAKALYDGGKPADAEKLLQAVDEESKEYAEAQYYLGRIAYDRKEYDDAADYFEEASEANDKSALYVEWLGNTYGMIASDANVVRQGFLAPKMKDAWEKAVALDPKNISARQSLVEYYVQAPGFMGGSTEKAKETARQIIKLNAAVGHRTMGNLLVREKNIPEAEKEFLQMVKADASLTIVLSNFYVMHQQYDKAFAIFDDLLKKNPDDMSVIYQIGKTSALSGKQLDRGEESLKKYLSYTPKEKEPSHAGAYMRLAMINEKRGNKTEAKKLYQTALKLDKTLKEAEEGLARVSK